MITSSTAALRRLPRLVVLVLASVLVLSGCSVYDVPLPGGASVGSNPTHVKILFRDVLDLVPQSTVKVNDVTVGKITKVQLRGYVAEVDVELMHNVNLPSNTVATIRQTSLLGEKFVSLAPPSNPSSSKLRDGQTIDLDHSSRNPEVEEVLGALSLLLNGGGVGQLKTIAENLNTATDGREQDFRSVLEQIRTFTGQLDANKQSIVGAIENLNRLAVEIRQQDATVKSALDNIPQALASINRQRGALVKLLKSLARLSNVGVRVIQASKQSTINGLRDLAPVLERFAAAGQSFPRSFQVLLTYPFVDAAVGSDPQVARNIHMGDYTNLSARLDINLGQLPKLPTIPGLPPVVCQALAQILDQTRNNVNQAVDQVVTPIPVTPLFTQNQKDQLRQKLRDRILQPALDQAKNQCSVVDVNTLAATATDLIPSLLDVITTLTPAQIQQLLQGTGSIPAPGTPNPPTLPGVSLPGGLKLNRAAPGSLLQKASSRTDPFNLERRGLDPSIGTMLLQGVSTQR